MIYILIKKYLLTTLLLFVLLSIQIIPFVFTEDKKDTLAVKLMLGMMYYPTKLINEIRLKITNKWESYIYLVNLKEENENLKGEIENLIKQNHKLKELKFQNENLKKLLNYKESYEEQGIIANVISSSPSLIRSDFVIIDRGKKHGIKKGMPISTNLGIVGRIYSAGGKSSMVMLITDPLSAVDALVQRTRARGIVNGLGNKCIIKYIEKENSILIGDKIISSGKDDIYTKGMLIGTVTKITKSNNGLYEAIVEPEVDTDTLEEVLVIIKPKLKLAEFNE